VKTFDYSELPAVRRAVRSIRRGDPITNDDLETSLRIIRYLVQAIAEMGPHLHLALVELRRYRDVLESFADARGMKVI